jgi:hypothetical protein
MLSLATSPLSFSAPIAPMVSSRSLVRMQGATPPAPPAPPTFSVKDLPGISGPFGYFDPLGYCEGASEGKVKFYRGEPPCLVCRSRCICFRKRCMPPAGCPEHRLTHKRITHLQRWS